MAAGRAFGRTRRKSGRHGSDAGIDQAVYQENSARSRFCLKLHSGCGISSVYGTELAAVPIL